MNPKFNAEKGYSMVEDNLFIHKTKPVKSIKELNAEKKGHGLGETRCHLWNLLLSIIYFAQKLFK